MAYSMESATDGYYPGTACLINKLGIRDEVALAETAAAVVFGKASLLDQQPITGGFDFDHYKRIHQFLFCDLYDWAGQIRTINISKKGTAFVPAAEIELCADACFKRLAVSAVSACPIMSWRGRLWISWLTFLSRRLSNRKWECG